MTNYRTFIVLNIKLPSIYFYNVNINPDYYYNSQLFSPDWQSTDKVCCEVRLDQSVFSGGEEDTHYWGGGWRGEGRGQGSHGMDWFYG